MGWLDWLFGSKTQTPAPTGHDIELPSETPAGPATKPSEACIALVKREEGFLDKAYPDYNGYAIGYGCHEVDGKPVVKGQTIDLAGADRACRQKAQQCATAVRIAAKRPLKQHQLDALVDFVYNAGLGALQQSTILKTINTNGTVTEDMFTRWNKVHDPVTGEVKVHDGLTARRKVEYQLWITP